MTLITDDVINNTPNDYNLFLMLKKNMINGEVRLPNLSSKNRSLLHKICYNYGLEHFSTGNYKNRIIIIKDPQHTYFSNNTNLDKKDTFDKAMFNYFLYKNENEDKKVEKQYEEEDGGEENEENEENEEEENKEEEDEEYEDEEEDTDTYSSNSSECSESSSTAYQLIQNANISNQLNTLRMFSYINLIMNVIIICNL
tara:strand:+ start:602 stop:1195 length:594 start_codon:yes stop_codon:yes gene_type:complete